MTEVVSIRRVGLLDTRFAPRRWEWAEENRMVVEAFWRDAIAAKPKMFNGKVLLAGSYEEGPDWVGASYFEADFASFLCWARLGFPDKAIANGFALAALRCDDGAYICGIMGEHTANAGKVYFPGGTPDLADIRPSGTVDFLGSVLRELEEETGLGAADVVLDEGWVVLNAWPLLAYLKPMRLAGTAEGAVARLETNIARQKEPELAGFRIVRAMADAESEDVPPYLRAFFRHVLENEAVSFAASAGR